MNTSKGRTINRSARIALLFAIALPLVAKVYASGPFATNYTNASLNGVYGYSSAGDILGPSNGSNTTNSPAAFVGLWWFDGNGTFKFYDIGNVAGGINQRGTANDPIVGTYAVNPDGTGTIHWVTPLSGLSHTRDFVIVDAGKEIQFIVADDISTQRGVAKKQ